MESSSRGVWTPSTEGDSEAGSRYELLERLDDDGSGERWRARDRVTGAAIEYKLVAEGSPDGAGSRVEGELRLLSSVRHANLAAVIDSGRTAAGRLFCVTEPCEGEPLDALSRSSAMPFDRARQIVLQIGRAVVEVQKAGVLHRELSPQNVLVSAAGAVKVINVPFAVVALGGAARHRAPEQVGDRAVDRRANIYNLAAILYQLLTGRPPVQDDSSIPAAPSRQRTASKLSPEVDRVVMRGLERLAGDRQPTLRAFLAELEALAPCPASAPGPGDVARDGKSPAEQASAAPQAAPPAQAPAAGGSAAPRGQPRNLTMAGFATVSALRAREAEAAMRSARAAQPEPAVAGGSEGRDGDTLARNKDEIARMVAEARAATAPPAPVVQAPPAAPALDDLTLRKHEIAKMVERMRTTAPAVPVVPAEPTAPAAERAHPAPPARSEAPTVPAAPVNPGVEVFDAAIAYNRRQARRRSALAALAVLVLVAAVWAGATRRSPLSRPAGVATATAVR